MTPLEEHLEGLKRMYKKMNPGGTKPEIKYLENLRLVIEELEKLLNEKNGKLF